MLTVTISGERGEGKTMLATVLRLLLATFTKYRVQIVEAGVPEHAQRMLASQAERTTIADLAQIKAVNVTVVVANTNHLHPRMTRQHGVEFYQFPKV